MPDRNQIMLDIEIELERARSKFPIGFHSGHEGYGVILEELDELWNEVKQDNYQNAVKEAYQVAAMAIRFIEDIGKLNGL